MSKTGIAFRPGQVCRWEPGRGFEVDGRPNYIVGTNYVTGYVCTNFWEDWRPEAVAEDLDRIAAAGLNVVRIPVQWEYAEPEPGQFRPEMLKRMDAFFEMAAGRGLLVMPWFLVGVATQTYDVSWRNGGSGGGSLVPRPYTWTWQRWLRASPPPNQRPPTSSRCGAWDRSGRCRTLTSMRRPERDWA